MPSVKAAARTFVAGARKGPAGGRHSPPVTQLLKRPAQLRGWALLVLLLFALVILVGMIWRNLERVDSLGSYVSYWHRVQAANQSMKKALMDHLSGRIALDHSQMLGLSNRVHALVDLGGHLDSETPEKLLAVERSLIQGESHSPDVLQGRLLAAMAIMNSALDDEVSLREEALADISQDTRYEVAMASVTLAAILLFSWVFFRLRILAPLHDLRELLLRLAEEDFRPMDTQHLDPLLLPVFNSYNEMVKSLGELEAAKRLHAESLEAEVRAATQALLEQQRSLAQAERLAAVGEMAAGVAHELRNPLAGIQMSCVNLRSEIDNSDQATRLELIIAELKRMARLLTQLLEQSKQAPAPSQTCDVSALVRELVALARYQIPAQIELDYRVPESLICRIPESGVRQVLLNLVLNASQAIEPRPGKICIELSREAEWLQITVFDDGPGFSDDLLRGGVRPFASGRPQGTGLGLAIVQRTMRESGGQMQLSNLDPHGACVTLKLPFRPA